MLFQPVADLGFDHERVLRPPHPAFHPHLKLNHVTGIQQTVAGRRIQAGIIVRKVTMVFAPKYCFLIIKIAPKYDTNHSLSHTL